MAAQTRTGQGNSPGSVPNSPRHTGCGRGWTERNTPSCPNSHNDQTGLGQNASACNVSAGHRTGTTGQSHGNAQGPKGSQGGTLNRKDTSSLQCFRCQGWGHMVWECATPAKTLNQSRGNWGNAAHPHQHQPQQPKVGSQHSLPGPKPKPAILKAAKKKGWLEVAPVPFLNPDPITHLVGCSNGVPVIVNGQEATTLIDSGAQVSSVSSQFCKELAWQIQPLVSVNGARGDGGAAIPYLGLMEVNLQIPGITNYNEDVLLLVKPTMTCSEAVPVVVGSKIINRALSLMTKGELAKAHFGAVISWSLQLTHTTSDKTGMREGVGHYLSKGWPCRGEEVLSWWC